MESRSRARTSSVHACVLLGAVSIGACAGGGDPAQNNSEPVRSTTQFVETEASEWVACAGLGQRCNFSGTREVLLLRIGASAVGTFTGGVQCSAENFAVSGGWFGRCYLGAEVGGGGDAGVPDAGSEPDGGSTEPDAGTGDLPTGSSGFATRRVRTTSEVPTPSDQAGQFRTVCDFSHMNYDDPIVYPGQPGASHLHAYFGNTRVDAHTNDTSLLTTGNSTCRGGIVNRSGYWVPAMLDRDGQPITPGPMGVYYKSGYVVPPASIRSFPPGLRIIAGGRHMQPETLPSRYATYNCLSHGYNPSSSIPSCPPGDTLILSIRFPQCWDGRSLDSADHRSHMAYPQQPVGCPASHPVAIPEITFNVHYTVPSSGTSRWRLSSDMPGVRAGESLHGDWYAGWETPIVDEFVRGCNNAAVDCQAHLLGPYREIY